MTANRFATMTRNNAPIYNIWDPETGHIDAWTHDLVAALTIAERAAVRHGVDVHVTAYAEYVDANGYTETDFQDYARITTYTPEGEEPRA